MRSTVTVIVTVEMKARYAVINIRNDKAGMSEMRSLPKNENSAMVRAVAVKLRICVVELRNLRILTANLRSQIANLLHRNSQFVAVAMRCSGPPAP